MMKYSEMDKRQRRAFKNIRYAAMFLIGGLENTISDNDEDNPDYISAKNDLSNHDELVSEVYRMATTELYVEGGCWFGKTAEKITKELRLCGKEFLMECCESRVKKMGY